jgi:hypothetical protein
MLAEQLQQVVYADEQTQSRLIQILAKDPAITVDEAIKAAYSLYFKGPWQLAVQLIVVMGYPRNEPAIERFISDISLERNVPYVELYLTTFNQIGVQVVAPYIIRTMLDTSHDQDPIYLYKGQSRGLMARFRDINGILDYILPRDLTLARLCGPTLAYLLAQVIAIPELEAERSYYLSAFQKLGVECAFYALPALIGMVQKWGIADRDSKEAMELIESFPKEVLEPYKYLLRSLPQRE